MTRFWSYRLRLLALGFVGGWGAVDRKESSGVSLWFTGVRGRERAGQTARGSPTSGHGRAQTGGPWE